MTATSRHQENRLTDEDRAAMRSRVTETARVWGRAAWPKPWVPGQTDIDALVRLAGHAIGCSAYDLRDVELAEIREMVLTITTGARP